MVLLQVMLISPPDSDMDFARNIFGPGDIFGYTYTVVQILGSIITVHDIIRWLYLFTDNAVYILGSDSKVTVQESRYS